MYFTKIILVWWIINTSPQWFSNCCDFYETYCIFRDLLWLKIISNFQNFKLIKLLVRSGDGHIERSPLQDRDWEPAPVEMRQTSPDPVEKKEMKKLPIPRTRKTRQVPDDNPVEQV